MLDLSRAIWIDFETAASAVNLKTAGAVRYAADPSTQAIVLAWAVDDDTAQSWHATGDILDWRGAPPPLKAAFGSARPLIAWNAGFDREIWNYATLGFPLLGIDRVIDAMVQAIANSLPADLEGASQRLSGGGKQANGKALIKLFCVECAKPSDHPEEWDQFLSYAARDIETMRHVMRATRLLPEREWDEYHAFERINVRGLAINLPLIQGAAALAAEDRRHSGRRLGQLTGGHVTAVTQVGRLTKWLHDTLPEAEMRAILEQAPDPDEDHPDEDEGDVGGRRKLSLNRAKASALRVRLTAKQANGGISEGEAKALEAVTLREFGGSAAPAKFARMDAQHVDGVIAGQYVFSGASQTGRMSSRGIQIHNLTRDAIGSRAVEAATVNLIAHGGCTYEEISSAEPADMPVARKLGLLVRPAIVARPKNILVWSDWSAIEARVLPWLANTALSGRVLDVFSGNDANPELPDIYEVNAAGIVGKLATEVTKIERQTGKVATLALGFGGGYRALQRMAVGYDLVLDDREARNIVDRWRCENSWAPAFWDQLWDAALNAWAAPGTMFVGGRVAFRFLPGYLGGTLFMALPSGRLLSYPDLQWSTVIVRDDRGRGVGTRDELTFRRAYGRMRLWKGILAENATQACAADILRGTVARIENDPELAFMPLVGHTHDEVLTEPEEARADEAAARLKQVMNAGFDWSEGLPLATEETISHWYSKARKG